MKKILFAGILILLLFVGTAAAVSVDYASQQVIPVSTARDNANSALISYVAQGMLGTSAALWKGASLSQTPITIYDQSGVVYSYLFDVINEDGKIVGQVNAAGNKLVGEPVISIEKTPRSFDPDVVIPKVSQLARGVYTGAQINYVVFIMGLDMKIGVMVILTDKNGLTHRMIYDLQTYNLQSDQFSYPGLVNAATKSSVLTQMSSSTATLALQDYDSQTRSIASVIPVMRRVIPVNYLNITKSKFPGLITVKPLKAGNLLSEYKPSRFLTVPLPNNITSTSANLPKGRTSVSSSTIGQQLPVSRFYPV